MLIFRTDAMMRPIFMATLGFVCAAGLGRGPSIFMSRKERLTRAGPWTTYLGHR
jgi:hypothetical protein